MHKDRSTKKASLIKYLFYLLIVKIIILGTWIHEVVFQVLALIIVLVSLFELIKIFYQNHPTRHIVFFICSILVFIITSAGFLYFSFMQKEIIIYTYFLVMISDAFSQQSGQIFGKHKVFPKISPDKTLAGVIGGMLITMFSSMFIHDLIGLDMQLSAILGLSISIVSILGDLSASYYKRKFRVKDFSKLIPGHGGFLDRFDSFLLVGAFMFIFLNFIC